MSPPPAKKKETPTEETHSANLDRRNPISYWAINLRRRVKEVRHKRKLKAREKKKKKALEPTFIPREFGLGSIKDFAIGIKIIFAGNPITLLCLTIPFAIASYAANWGPTATFVLCMLSIIPLAKLLGEATEELALRTNQTIGGLLNATFGNAVELIVAIVALDQYLYQVVQSSLLGSILSNLLLVMGMSFLLGGMKYKEQYFNQTGAQTSASLLTLAVMAILFPAAFFISGAAVPEDLDNDTLLLSRITSIVILLIYISYLIFQLKTHAHLFADVVPPEQEKKKGRRE